MLVIVVSLLKHTYSCKRCFDIQSSIKNLNLGMKYPYIQDGDKIKFLKLKELIHLSLM